MSCIRCDRCPEIIDSDDDPECFLSDDYVLCEACREWTLADERALLADLENADARAAR